MMDHEDDDFHPMSGLGWSPTWYPISVSHRTSNPPPSLVTMSMATVLQYPDLLEEICPLIPTSLRRDMIALALEQEMDSSSLIPLLSTWSEPVLSLKSIFPTINYNPELLGDLHNQVRNR